MPGSNCQIAVSRLEESVLQSLSASNWLNLDVKEPCQAAGFFALFKKSIRNQDRWFFLIMSPQIENTKKNSLGREHIEQIKRGLAQP